MQYLMVTTDQWLAAFWNMSPPGYCISMKERSERLFLYLRMAGVGSKTKTDCLSDGKRNPNLHTISEMKDI